MEKLLILYTHPKGEEWFERKSTVSYGQGERVIPYFPAAHITP